MLRTPLSSSFFFNDTATTEIYTLSLHDALPISLVSGPPPSRAVPSDRADTGRRRGRSEEHTSELQSRPHLVCRLLLEKKKQIDVNVVGDRRESDHHRTQIHAAFTSVFAEGPTPS